MVPGIYKTLTKFIVVIAINLKCMLESDMEPFLATTCISISISLNKWSRAHIAGAQANLEPRRIESTPAFVSQARFSSGPVSSSTGACFFISS